MTRWPNDDPKSLAKFYGDPGKGQVEQQLVPVIPPFRMTYAGKPISRIMFHKKAAPALRAALDAIWAHYGKNQKTIDALGISKYSGAYNHRLIRGSKTKWSNHAYGAAIDINAEENGFNTGHGNMPQPVIDAFKAQGALWGGDYSGRTDPMHFEFCSRPSAKPVAFVDPPQTDGDSDSDTQADIPAIPPAVIAPVVQAPKLIGPLSKSWHWITAAFASVGSVFASMADWRVAGVFVVGALIVFLVIWFSRRDS